METEIFIFNINSLKEEKMECVWLVQEGEVTVAVCDTETTANKIIKFYPDRVLQKRKESIVADAIGNKFYYYH
jgi:hypothetical protein